MKEITPLFETIGKRRKLIGFRATYGAVEVGTFDTHAEAEAALDRFVYDELTRVAA
jgi:hypothetical protein